MRSDILLKMIAIVDDFQYSIEVDTFYTPSTIESEEPFSSVSFNFDRMKNVFVCLLVFFSQHPFRLEFLVWLKTIEYYGQNDEDFIYLFVAPDVGRWEKTDWQIWYGRNGFCFLTICCSRLISVCEHIVQSKQWTESCTEVLFRSLKHRLTFWITMPKMFTSLYDSKGFACDAFAIFNIYINQWVLKVIFILLACTLHMMQ